MSGWGRGRQCAEWFSHALTLAARRPSGSTAATCPPSIWEGVQSRRLLQASGTGQHSTVLQPVLGQTRGFYRSSAALAEALSSQEIPASKADEDDIPSDEVCLTKEGGGPHMWDAASLHPCTHHVFASDRACKLCFFHRTITNIYQHVAVTGTTIL